MNLLIAAALVPEQFFFQRQFMPTTNAIINLLLEIENLNKGELEIVYNN